MKPTTLDVPKGFPVMTLREFLQREYGFSTTLWKKLRRSDSFRKNGIKISAARAMIEGGDRLSWYIEEESRIVPANIPLDIRYEDDSLLVVNKPAGMLVHPTGGEHSRTLANAVLFHYERRGEQHAFHPMHRLDRQTSGLVLIAKEPHVQHRLAAPDSTGMARLYLAAVEGALPEPRGTIDLPIARRPGSIIERMVSPEGKRAVTHHVTLCQADGLSLLALRLATGRTHQIRVHLAHLGFPLLGDDLYGGSTERLARQALHAHCLHLRQPLSGEELAVRAPLPSDMAALFPKIAADFLFSQKIHDAFIKL